MLFFDKIDFFRLNITHLIFGSVFLFSEKPKKKILLI